MRFVSFLLSVSHAGHNERVMLADKRRVLPYRQLTLVAQLWADDQDEHRFDVIDEAPVGGERRLVAHTTPPSATGLVSLELALPALEAPGSHRLHFEVDGRRLTCPIDLEVKDVPRRGPRPRYKGRGALPPASLADERRAGPRLFHAELFPLERPAPVGDTMSGLWMSVYLTGFSPDDEGAHFISVSDARPDGSSEVVGVRYCSVTGPHLTFKLDLDPLTGPGAHRLDLAFDGQAVGHLEVTL